MCRSSPVNSPPAGGIGVRVLTASRILVPKCYACAFLAQQEKPKRIQILVLFRRIYRFSFCTSHEIQHFCASDVVVATLVAMVFFFAVFATRAPAMGNSAGRAWQLSQLVEGVLTAFNPSHGSLSYVQAGHCVSKQIGRHDAACHGCPRCVSRSPEARFRVLARAVRVS